VIIYLLTAAALLSALLCIYCDYVGNRRGVYVFKPATMIFIIVLAVILVTQGAAPTYGFWIIAGLICSLAGDIVLMLPRDRFLGGLLAFLLAHWCYIAAFVVVAPDPNLVEFLPWLLAGLAVFVLLKPVEPVMRAAVLAYIVSIFAMGWLAIQYGGEWSGGVPVAIGAGLFMLSDALIGIRRFRSDWPSAQALILGSYFPAQWFFAVSLSAS